jgi:2C-methyl-D-erythritol 2,4-cyclodiphosphate synthase
MALAGNKGYRIGNLDATIVAQRLLAHTSGKCAQISRGPDADLDRVNVKAKPLKN